jgi:SAM-dependent methyltransferase
VPEPGDWLAIARAENADDVREHILTGYKAGKPFTPYEPTLALPQPLECVLDFGCGLGRNFPYLKQVAAHVTGFDLPPMVARCRSVAADPAVQLDDDWARLREQRFDLVFASLVLQHLDPAICSRYLGDFSRMAPDVYLLTRTDSDFNTSVLEWVADSGLYEAGECVEVDHDPVTNHLRVLGTTSFDRARRMTGGRHYEVLLRVRSDPAGSR